MATAARTRLKLRTPRLAANPQVRRAAAEAGEGWEVLLGLVDIGQALHTRQLRREALEEEEHERQGDLQIIMAKNEFVDWQVQRATQDDFTGLSSQDWLEESNGKIAQLKGRMAKDHPEAAEKLDAELSITASSSVLAKADLEQDEKRADTFVELAKARDRLLGGIADRARALAGNDMAQAEIAFQQEQVLEEDYRRVQKVASGLRGWTEAQQTAIEADIGEVRKKVLWNAYRENATKSGDVTAFYNRIGTKHEPLRPDGTRITQGMLPEDIAAARQTDLTRAAQQRSADAQVTEAAKEAHEAANERLLLGAKSTVALSETPMVTALGLAEQFDLDGEVDLGTTLRDWANKRHEDIESGRDAAVHASTEAQAEFARFGTELWAAADEEAVQRLLTNIEIAGPGSEHTISSTQQTMLGNMAEQRIAILGEMDEGMRDSSKAFRREAGAVIAKLIGYMPGSYVDPDKIVAESQAGMAVFARAEEAYLEGGRSASERGLYIDIASTIVQASRGELAGVETDDETLLGRLDRTLFTLHEMGELPETNFGMLKLMAPPQVVGAVRPYLVDGELPDADVLIDGMKRSVGTDAAVEAYFEVVLPIVEIYNDAIPNRSPTKMAENTRGYAKALRDLEALR